MVLYFSKYRTGLLFLTLLFSFNTLLSQYTSLDNYSGLWTENTTWVGGVAPPVTNIDANINIYGTVIRQGDLDYAKQTLHVYDTLLIYGNLVLGNLVELIVEPGGVFIVFGDYTSQNKVSVSTFGTFVVLGDLNMLGSSNQGSFENEGVIYIANPVNVFHDGNFTDLACDDPDDYPDNCAYGNMEDLMEDPIFELIAGGGYKINYSPPLDFCEGDSVRLHIRNNADSYEWFLDGITIEGATSFEYYAKQGGDYTAQVIVGNDTFNLSAVAVTVYTTSIIPDSAYSSDSVICSGSPATITLSYGGGSLGDGAVAMWYDDAGLTNPIGSGNDLSITAPSVETTYYVRFEGQCDTTSARSVTVSTGTTPSPVMTGASIVCVPSRETYTVAGDPGSSFLWSVTGGTINGPSEGTVLTVDWEGAGTGTVEVTEITTAGCAASDNINVEKAESPGIGNILSSGSLTRR